MQRERRVTTDGNGLVFGLSLLIATSLFACGNSHIGGYFDGGRRTDGGLDGTDVRKDSTIVDAGPPPPVGAGSKVLVPGNARLVGQGADSCSNQTPASSDRWCAFARPSNFLGLTDLWVINVTQALAGKVPACDGNSPNCLRLTSSLFAGDLTRHGFGGDTLIYYAENNGDSMNFVGTVFAWRPEWVVPRALTSQTGLSCQAHPRVASVLCLENPVTDATTKIFSVDLVAGKLDATNTGLLPKLDTVLYSAPGDPTSVTKFQAAFSPTGDAALWSARTTAAGSEILNSQTLNVPGSRKVVAQDVAHWQVSSDSASWYWLKSFNYSVSGADSGTLQVAPYPAGTPATDVLPNVGQYTAVGSNSVVIRTGLKQGAGDLKLITDVTNAAGTTKAFDSGVLSIWDMSSDGTTVLYSKTTTGMLYDMYLHSVKKTAPCALASTATALGFGRLAENTLTAAWVKVVSQTDTGAFYTTFDQCTSRQFSTNIITFDAVGDQGYVYEDEGSNTDPEGTLRFNQLVNGLLGTTGKIVQTRAFTTTAVLWPSHAALLYSINVNNSTDGLYINGTLPFTGTQPPPGFDGGVDMTPGDVAASVDATAEVPAPAHDAGDTAAAADAGAETTPPDADAAGG